MTGQQFQRFRHGDTIEKVCVRTTQTSTNNNSASSYYVSLEDVQDVFPQALRFKLNENPVPFLLGPDERRIEPLRIAFYPDGVLEVIIGSSQPTTVIHSPAVRNLYILPSQHHLFSSSNLPQSFNPSHGDGELEQVEMINSGLAQKLSDIEKHLVENKENSLEMKEMRRQITDLLLEVKEHNNKVVALQLEAKEKDDKVALIQRQMIELQNQVIDLPNQALDRLAILQKHAYAIFIQNFELHEYTIPRLFIILPVDKARWNPTRILENKFRLHFLCEYGDHTMEASKGNENQIHIAKHEGYEIKNDTEFYKKYGKYMLILMRSLKLWMKSTDISIPHIPLPTLLDAGINYSIEYMEALSKDNPVLKNINTIDDYEGLKGTDFRQLDTFLRINDQNKEIGGPCRTATKTGDVKWVCIEHYRLTYREEDQEAFAEIVTVNGGKYDWRLGRVSIVLGSDIKAQKFFDALAKARHVYDLDIKFDWRCFMSDIEAFREALKTNTALTTLNLYENSIGNESVLALSEALTTNTTLTTLDLEDNWIGKEGALALSGALKINTSLTTLNLSDNSIGNEGALALSGALKANTTLTTLDLSCNSIRSEGALGLSGALKINATLTTLNLSENSIRNEGALALSGTLKANTTLTTLNLSENSIRSEGALELSGALKTNATLTALNLSNNPIGKEGALALSGALMANATLTTLDLSGNSIGKEGALELSGALMVNTTLTTLNLHCNSIGNEAALALSGALMANATLTTLDLSGNSIGKEGALELSGALKANTALTTLDLKFNAIGEEGALALSEVLRTKTTLTLFR
ncbi:hypothetical protein BGZ49_003389 [Haplosporangium sp. Z 27]|nr:hypothetical protein BGZ49_003389 [Haplosporangium sp. Z 27]